MTTDAEQNGQGIEEQVLSQLDDIDESLVDKLADDERVQSGIPEDQRGNDVEFIQMSGLTSPEAAQDLQEETGSQEGDASRPLSFYEKGVADVDSDMAPGTLEDAREANSVLSTEREDAGVPRLRDMLRETAQGERPGSRERPRAEAVVDLPDPGPDPAPDEGRPAEPEASTDPASMLEMEDEASGADRGDEGSGAEVVMGPEAVPPDLLEAEDLAEALGAAQDAPPSGSAPEPADPAPGAAPTDTVAPDELQGLATGSQEASEDAALAEETGPPEIGALEESPEEGKAIEPAERSRAMDLADAEEFLTELQDQPRPSRDEEPHRELPPTPAARIRWEPAEEDEPGEESLTPYRRRHHTHRHHRRTLARFVAVLVLVAVVAVAGYVSWAWLQRSAAGPETLLAQAARFEWVMDYESAAEVYEQFAQRFPDHPASASAQFNAAFMLPLLKDDEPTKPRATYERAIERFERFIKDNPAHDKVARAETMIGVLYHRLGEHRKAIERLHDPELRLRDPTASLAILRTLAASYAMVGDYAQAQSAFLQAAALADNSSPDVDFVDLGDMYLKIAEKSTVSRDRREYQQLAIEYWERGTQFPGIAPTTKNEIERRIRVLEERMGDEAEAGASAESPGEESVEMIVMEAETVEVVDEAIEVVDETIEEVDKAVSDGSGEAGDEALSDEGPPAPEPEGSAEAGEGEEASVPEGSVADSGDPDAGSPGTVSAETP